MQLNANFSFLQAFQFSQTSYTTTKLSGNALQEEITDNKANGVPQLAVNEQEKGASSVLAKTELSDSNFNLSDFQKSVLDRALSKVAEIKSEMLSLWDELFGTSGAKASSKNLSLEAILNTSLSSSNLGNGISISQGFTQSLEISMQGSVITSDGSKKEINLSIGISQSFMQNLQLNEGKISNLQNGSISTTGPKKKLVDPLVINYDGNSSELSDEKMRFDLDSDGVSDQISTLKKGSGFLALDKNNDGKINNGNELFGTKSGDGFKDLSIYDENKDGKIDKEDPIYDKLRIWTPDKNGEGQLVGLGEKGIGAIYLNAKDSKEMLYGKNGDLLGVKQKSADFLFENGQSGKIHHIDLVSEQIKNEALSNQAQNDAILRAVKVYGNADFNANFAKITQGVAKDSNLFGLENSLSLSVQISFSALQSGNGVNSEVSKFWIKIESDFNHILYNSTKNQNTDSVEKGNINNLMESIKELNHLVFDPLNLKERAQTFKDDLINIQNLYKLLSVS